MAPLTGFLQWSTTTAALLLLFAVSTRASEIGVPHDTVIDLTDETFDSHMNDPANGLWFLKFYAPWCGHCKQLAPKLDQAAPFLAGKMAIGKIDCTLKTTKKKCKEFDVRGYPTLKFYRDGEFHDYPGGRHIDEIITFGEKMSASAVALVSSADEVMEKVVSKNADGVAFLAYDPAASSSKKREDAGDDAVLEEMIQSTKLTQVFGQVARKMQASASFGMLSPDISATELKALGLDIVAADGGFFLVQIEKDLLGYPKVYSGEINSPDYLTFVKNNNVALVTDLGPHNFRTLTTMGKLLAIGVVNPDDSTATEKFETELKTFALNGPSEVTEKYLFAVMDGKQWHKFVRQFGVESENLPDIFILNEEDRKFWQDSTINGLPAFFEAMEAGEIESRKREGRKGMGTLEVILDVFVSNLPYSALALSFIIAAFFALFIFGGDDDDLIEQMNAANEKQAKSKADVKGKKESAGEKDSKVEGKKEQ
mmetsp:Transcript_28290/g.41056  ORF Transcript_28290/g.41056 Transcript_28290/m.41056 type:complete len:482 (+) Transcript_28290:104-1549(+)